MARKLSTLFFSMAQRMARDQQRAVQRAARTAVALSTRAVERAVSSAAGAPTKAATSPRRAGGATRHRDAAAAPIPGRGTWERHVHRGSTAVGQWHGRLTYCLYLPERATTPSSVIGLPLVVMLHGCQQSAADLARGTRFNRLADREGFVVAWPQQSANAQSQRCWRWFRPQHGHGGSEADAIASLARALVARLHLDGTRVYVAGLSAGAGMAALTALRHPDVFAAVGMHSGAVLGDAYHLAAGVAAMRRGSRRDIVDQARRLLGADVPFDGMPAIIVHGGRDRTVDVRNARQLVEQFRDLNGLAPDAAAEVSIMAAGTPRAWQCEDLRVGRRPVVRLAFVPTLGHAWSGGDPTVRFNEATGPDAGLLFWRFFETTASAAASACTGQARADPALRTAPE